MIATIRIPKLRRRLVLLLPLVLPPISGLASEWTDRRASLRVLFQVEEFRVFYDLEGPDQLPTEFRSDADGDGTPDLVQNIALQMVVARELFTEVLGLRHPFAGARYKRRTKYIDINLLKFPLKKGGPKNGVAYDGIVDFERPIDKKRSVKVLAIDLSNRVNVMTATPAHELFHLYQNGYTMFKNRWYTEGTARWAEYAFKRGVGKAGRFPRDHAELQELLGKSYTASGFWNALCVHIDPSGMLIIPRRLEERTYVGGVDRVLDVDHLHGVGFIKALLRELDKQDAVASRDRGRKSHHWKESAQKDPGNNRYIWNAVKKVLKRDFPSFADSPPVREMINLRTEK